ncbi:MAG: hypothetical protein FWF32_02220 [Endomicrobia bacterium]|nr:hypothetical protein [Endomicrobiia bacterium]
MAEIRASNTPITSTPLIADLFGKGYLNILFANSTDMMQVIDTNSRILKNFRVWPMFMGNPEHTGFKGMGAYKAKYRNMLFGGIILFVVFIFFKIRSAVKKSSKKVKVQFL